MSLDPKRQRHIEELLALVRDGRAPPEFIFPTRSPEEAELVRAFLRGRRGNAAFVVIDGGCTW